MELYARNLVVQSNQVYSYPLEGIAVNSTDNATVTGNTVTNNSTSVARGGILVSTAPSLSGECGDPRNSRDVTISSNTSSGQTFGVQLADVWPSSRNILDRATQPYAVSLTGNNLSGNSSQVGQDNTVSVNGYSGPVPFPVIKPSGPRNLGVRAISPETRRCSPGSRSERFMFSASDAGGIGSINWMQGLFTISPQSLSTVHGCLFFYDLASNVLYLRNGDGDNPYWVGSSAVGTGNDPDPTNGYCTIHARTSPLPAADPLNPNIYNLTLDIEFLFPGSLTYDKSIFSITGDYQGRQSDTFTWAYWGWWKTP